VEQIISPLKTEITTLKEEMLKLRTELAPMLAALRQELPSCIKEAQAILKSIPEDVLKELNVVNIGFDPKIVWMSLVRKDGTSVSIKKTEMAFRVRVRDQSGALLKELEPSPNGLIGALKSLV
jgi:hypothetical protein